MALFLVVALGVYGLGIIFWIVCGFMIYRGIDLLAWCVLAPFWPLLLGQSMYYWYLTERYWKQLRRKHSSMKRNRD